MTAEQHADAPPLSPLLAQVLEHNAAQAQAATNTVIADLERRLELAEARNHAVVAGVEALLRGPWAPTSDALREALYPLDDVVEAQVERDRKAHGERGWLR